MTTSLPTSAPSDAPYSQPTMRSRPARRALLAVGLLALLFLAPLLGDRHSEQVSADTRPYVGFVGSSSVTEGETVHRYTSELRKVSTSFVISSVLSVDLTVNVEVTQEGDFASPGSLGRKQVVIPANTRYAQIDIPIVNDDVHEPDGAILVRIVDGDHDEYRYSRSPRTNPRRMSVRDDDAPQISIVEERIVVGEGVAATYVGTLQADREPYKPITVLLKGETAGLANPFNASLGSDFSGNTIRATFDGGSTSQQFSFTATDQSSGALILDDADAEGLERFFLSIQEDSEYRIGSRRSTTVLIVDDDTVHTLNDHGAYEVPPYWPLIPEGVEPGSTFRLLFVTSTPSDIDSADISDYDSYVQQAAASGHRALRPYSSAFRVVGSTATVDARDHTMTNTNTFGDGVPIYWLGGDRVANKYADFYDDSWASGLGRDEHGARIDAAALTGTRADGARHSTDTLGATNVLAGALTSVGGELRNPLDGAAVTRGSGRYYALSPLFRVPHLVQVSKTHLVAEEPATCTPGVGGRSGKKVTYDVWLAAPPPNGRSALLTIGRLYDYGVTEILRFRGHWGWSAYEYPGGEDSVSLDLVGNWPRARLVFNTSNWHLPRTVNVHIHCSNHDWRSPTELWHRLEHDLSQYIDFSQTRYREVKGYRRVDAQVFDTNAPSEPADLASADAYDGSLRVENATYAYGYHYNGVSQIAFQMKWGWQMPDKTHSEAYDYAVRHFSKYRIEVVANDALTPRPPVTTHREQTKQFIHRYVDYRFVFSRTGMFYPGNASHDIDPVYRITVTPMTIRGSDAIGDQAIMCVQLQTPPGIVRSIRRPVVVDCADFNFSAPEGKLTKQSAPAAQALALDVRRPQQLTNDGQPFFAYWVRLQNRPDADVRIHLAQATDSANVQLHTGSLHFTPEDWDRYRIVIVSPVAGETSVGDRIEIAHRSVDHQISAGGSVSATISATASDGD